jgi:hypothetical protein
MSSILIDVHQLVGQKLTKELGDQLDIIPNIRIMQPGMIYTMELRMGRINIHVNEYDIITHISHG